MMNTTDFIKKFPRVIILRIINHMKLDFSRFETRKYFMSFRHYFLFIYSNYFSSLANKFVKLQDRQLLMTFQPHVINNFSSVILQNVSYVRNSVFELIKTFIVLFSS